jgi:hypothetical protein
MQELWRSAPRPLRATLILAVAGQLLIVLASFGVLTRPAMLAVALPALGLLLWTRPVPWWGLLLLAPLALYGAYPPLAFDETLYHLPYVDSIARTGAITLRPDIRFGVFPLLHELLCVPLFAFLGATATHFVAWLAVALLGALLWQWWPERREAGWLASAVVLGNPTLLANGAITYVDATLTLFVAAGFWCLWTMNGRGSRLAMWFALAGGFLLGSAVAVKYLGALFAIGGLLYAGRRIVPYAIGGLIGSGPMLLRIFLLTGSPFHPFLEETAWSPAVLSEESFPVLLLRLVRLPIDLTVSRIAGGGQPPFTPFFAAALVLLLLFCRRWRLAGIAMAYLVAFVVLMPRDTRYVLPLVPLVVAVVADWASSRLSRRMVVTLAVIAAIPVVAYPLAHVAIRGLPPLRSEARLQLQEERIPALAALRTIPADGRIVVCGAEHLKFVGGDRLVGDLIGPYAYSRMFTGGLREVQASWILVGEPCLPEWRQFIARNAELHHSVRGVTVWRNRLP